VFYRFVLFQEADNAVLARSPVGRFRLAPDPNVPADVFMAFSGDQDGVRNKQNAPMYNNFEVLGAAAREIPDFFIMIGTS